MSLEAKTLPKFLDLKPLKSLGFRVGFRGLGFRGVGFRLSGLDCGFVCFFCFGVWVYEFWIRVAVFFLRGGGLECCLLRVQVVLFGVLVFLMKVWVVD